MRLKGTSSIAACCMYQLSKIVYSLHSVLLTVPPWGFRATCLARLMNDIFFFAFHAFYNNYTHFQTLGVSFFILLLHLGIVRITPVFIGSITCFSIPRRFIVCLHTATIHRVFVCGNVIIINMTTIDGVVTCYYVLRTTFIVSGFSITYILPVYRIATSSIFWSAWVYAPA